MPRNRSTSDHLPCTCPICDKAFTRPRSQIAMRKQVYCSRACAGVAKRRDGSPHWKGGRHVEANGYVKVSVNGRHEWEHRLVWRATHGPIPDGFEVHHKNECRADNRIANLELLPLPEHRRLHMRGRWSRKHDACRTCGTTERRHESLGLCHVCYERHRWQTRKHG